MAPWRVNMKEKVIRERNVEDTRPKRVPLHEQKRNILNASSKPGFVRRWVNIVEDRVDRFLKAGYRIVEDKDVQVGDVNENQTLGTGARKAVGQNVKAVLMEIPEDIYKEDQKAKQADITANEAGMRRKLNSGQNGTYGDVEINSTK